MRGKYKGWGERGEQRVGADFRTPTTDTQHLPPPPTIKTSPPRATDVIARNFKSLTAQIPTLHPTRPYSRGTPAVSDCHFARKTLPAVRRV